MTFKMPEPGFGDGEESGNMALTDTATTTGRRLLGSIRKIAFPRGSASQAGKAASPLRDTEKMIRSLAVEANTAADEIYSQLVNLGLHPQEVHASELVYFVLALTEYSLAKWSKATRNDAIIKGVVATVLARFARGSALSQKISQFRSRSRSYSNSLLLIDRTVSWKQGKPEFALSLSREVIGYEDYVAGTILWSTATNMLAVMRQIILQLEGQVQ